MASFWIAWSATLLLSLGLMAAVGWRLNDSIWSAFIDTRRTWSLAKFQLAWWFLVVPPLYAGVLWLRIRTNVESPLDLSIPDQVLALIGISVISTTVASGIKYEKNRPKGAGVLAAGKRILTRNTVKEARFSDMFAYDEGRDALQGLDVTKLQSFVFNVVLGLAYVGVTMNTLRQGGPAPDSLPDVSGTMTILLGLGQAGYLVGKAIPQNGIPSADPGTKAKKSASKAVSGGGRTTTTAPPIAASAQPTAPAQPAPPPAAAPSAATPVPSAVPPAVPVQPGAPVPDQATVDLTASADGAQYTLAADAFKEE